MKCKCGEEMSEINAASVFGEIYYCLSCGRALWDTWDEDKTYKWFSHKGLNKQELYACGKCGTILVDKNTDICDHCKMDNALKNLKHGIIMKTGFKDNNCIDICDGDDIIFGYGKTHGKVKWSDDCNGWHILWETGASDYLEEYLYHIYVIDKNC